MQRLISLALLAACHSTTTPVRPTAPAKLGPTLTKAELESRLADHRLHLVPDIERLPDGGDSTTAMLGNSPSLIVEGDVIAALYCRPGGIGPSLVADDHFLYIYFVQQPAMRIVSPDGRAQPTPSTYCSFQRYKVPAGLSFGGELRVSPAGP